MPGHLTNQYHSDPQVSLSQVLEPPSSALTKDPLDLSSNPGPGHINQGILSKR